MDEKVSVIIPTYNVEKYIKKCLESVLNQTYENVEIIVVDDGSTDDTVSVIETIDNTDKKIKLIKSVNNGVSSARNKALKCVSGTYVMFLDSDDYYHPNMVEKMCGWISENNDLVICDYIEKTDAEEKKNEITSIKKNKRYSEKEYLKCLAKDFNSLYFGALWNKIYRVDIIEDNQIRFDETICLGEDALFNLEYFRYINNIYVSSKHLYYHYMNMKSITNTISHCDMWNMSVIRFEKVIEVYEEKDILQPCVEEISFRILADIVFPIKEIMNSTMKSSDKIEELKNVCERNVVYFGFENMNYISFFYKLIKRNIDKKTYKKLYYELKLWNRIRGWD